MTRRRGPSLPSAVLLLFALPAFSGAEAGPGPRNGHRMAYDAARRVTVLFGGSGAQNEILGDTWLWDGRGWKNVDAAGPVPRSWHSMAYDERRQVVVLAGGRAAAGRSLDDTWEWDGTRWCWVAAGSWPARDHHAMTYDPVRDRVVLHGGFDGRSVFADTWEWDGLSWTRLSDAGPTPRAAHGIVFDPRSNKTLLHGGVDPPNRALGDTWAWEEGRWKPLLEESEERTHLAMAHDPFCECVFRFGGKDSGRKPFGDTWQFDSAGWLLVAGDGPSARIDHALVFDTARRTLVLFGGKTPDPGGVLFGDTWEWKGGGWTRLHVGR